MGVGFTWKLGGNYFNGIEHNEISYRKPNINFVKELNAVRFSGCQVRNI